MEKRQKGLLLSRRTRRKSSLRLGPNSKARAYDPTVTLRKISFIRKAILQAVTEGDYEAIMEIMRSHLDVMNRTHTAKSLGISRQSVHKIINKDSEPSLETFAHYMGALEDVSGTGAHISPR